MLANRFYLAFLLTVILVSVNQYTMRLPEVKSANAPSNEFSGERAYTILGTLLQENKAHPTGSNFNKTVKNRIIAELAKHNIEAEVQANWACAFRYNGCALVENITAIIPGETSSPYVALMSHYDSVPMAPGAGDDGSGVAAMLESARILKAEAPFKSPILLIFTDAEEMGLIGAEGFYRHNPLAKDVGILLNFEGSGSTGLSNVLRTFGLNGSFVDAFQNENEYPKGASLINEIFKRMPNDTDFSTAQRANTPGMDFAFAAERNHYHTPLDNVENMDPRTIQHQGENMLPLTRWLANNLDEATSAEHSLVYSNFYDDWLQWPKGYSIYILLASCIFLIFGLFRSGGTILGSLLGSAGALLTIVMTALLGFITFKLISFAHGTTVSWPADTLGYRIALFASTTTGAVTAAYVVHKYMSAANSLAGAWVLWALLSALAIYFIPDAANLLLAPLFVGTILLFAASFFKENNRGEFLLLSLVALVPSTLGLITTLEDSQGYRLIVSTFPFIALFMSIFVPLIYGAKLRIPLIAASTLTIIGMGIAISSPLYDANRPQHLNYNFIEDLDKGSAYYQLQSNNPIPEHIKNIIELESEEKKLIPFLNTKHRNYTQTDVSGYQGPKAEVLQIEQNGEYRDVTLKVSSQRNAASVQITTPKTANLSQFSLDGIIFQSKSITSRSYKDIDIIRLIGVYDREVTLTLRFKTADKIEAYIADISTELPETAKTLINKRPPLASPVHQGDQAVLFKKIAL